MDGIEGGIQNQEHDQQDSGSVIRKAMVDLRCIALRSADRGTAALAIAGASSAASTMRYLGM